MRFVWLAGRVVVERGVLVLVTRERPERDIAAVSIPPGIPRTVVPAILYIKSRANILTRVQSKAYTEPSSSVPCLTCRIARTFTTLARRGTLLRGGAELVPPPVFR